jgi:hypothetical protein
VVLWALWLSSGCYAAWTDNLFYFASNLGTGCLDASGECIPLHGAFDVQFKINKGVVFQVCSEMKAITAFSFFLWILRRSFYCASYPSTSLCCYLVMVYTSILLGLSIRAQVRGHTAWLKTVRDGTLLLPAEIAVASPAVQVSAPPVTVTVPQPEPSLPTRYIPSTTYHGFPEI